ncbi:OmpP1/FadL family transporter [Tropicimonas sp. IMCC6043]|uniref:OmpP1/FadL family transporter n=1 Tax=Tropicimonas sp. IMCC6043 TaxID=2510645 RepID=UPI00101CDD53|nr:outer membrane protein transport protein [Tropicimonas sp. IMCC6043]RYH10313.1 transporter [Tropicimonas sp. IMCC6043]
MTRFLATASVLAASTGAAIAGGLDRTGQPITALFEGGGETGGYFELSFARTWPSLSGTGVGRSFEPPMNVFGIPAGTRYSDVGADFSNVGTAIKVRFSERLSAALIFDQPYGADISYGGDPATTELGGTSAWAETNEITALLRYRFDERWSVHAGLRYQTAEGSMALSGLSYGITSAQSAGFKLMAGLPADFVIPSVNGYDVELDRDPAWGWVAGAAYEIPEIALRVSLTYSSAITHDMKTTENGLGAFGLPDGLTSTTEVKTPQSVNLEFQTGVAEDTLLYGAVRWVEWSAFKIDPEYFTAITGEGLVDLKDTTTYEIGLGRRFSEKWAGSVAVSYEAETGKLVSPLAPTNGLIALAVGASYDIGAINVSGGARYTWLGDADPETGTPDVARASFTGNDAISVGFRVGYDF